GGCVVSISDRQTKTPDHVLGRMLLLKGDSKSSTARDVQRLLQLQHNMVRFVDLREYCPAGSWISVNRLGGSPSRLVDTPNDFGRMGSQPTHPELLDWLAVWFRDEANGSLKQLHRLILTSETWRQSSRTATNLIDVDNRLLWRMNRQRMEAEIFRDSVLRMSGQLDLTMGGPGIEQFKKTKGPQSTPALDYTAYDWELPGAKRRSIYRVVWRGIPDPFMEAMDFPDLGLLAPKRGFSVSALQSLAVFNNDFVLRGSDWLARRVEREQPGATAQVVRAVELAWLRPPSEDEQVRSVAYVRKHGLPAFCRVLLNSNEFLFVD
ncbi:DUF1553 domain-containing protein, partial [Planctomycetota bacterium]